MTLIAATLAVTGCTSVHSSERASVGWVEPDRALGRVALLHRIGDVGREDARPERTEEAAQTAREAISMLPGVQLVEDGALQTALGGDDSWTRCSDYELVIAARQTEVDTVCVMDVNIYAGAISIGFNPLPGWWTESRVKYHLRLIDVHSGRLLADTNRVRYANRWFGLATPEPLSDALAADLRTLFQRNDDPAQDAG